MKLLITEDTNNNHYQIQINILEEIELNELSRLTFFIDGKLFEINFIDSEYRSKVDINPNDKECIFLISIKLNPL